MIQVKQLAELIKAIVGDEYLYMDHAIKTPNGFRIWALSASPDDRVYLSDDGNEWDELEQTDADYKYISAVLYSELSLIKRQYK
jgi:hypothetical protein